jgi:cytochrome c biogenesis protein CcmG/thiol:disulfide interchange protein DsbE
VSDAGVLEEAGAGRAAPKRRHTARWVALAAVVALIAVSIVLATRPSYQATLVPSPLIGKPAPAVSGTDFAGRRVSLTAYRGRYVFVNFFASWCPPCQSEEKDLVAFDFQQSKAGDGAALVSVVFDDSDTSARQFVSTWGATWPTVPDPGGNIANDYGVGSPPYTFLVNPKGVVVDAFAGPVTVSQLDGWLASARHGDG